MRYHMLLVPSRGEPTPLGDFDAADDAQATDQAERFVIGRVKTGEITEAAGNVQLSRSEAGATTIVTEIALAEYF